MKSLDPHVMAKLPISRHLLLGFRVLPYSAGKVGCDIISIPDLPVHNFNMNNRIMCLSCLFLSAAGDASEVLNERAVAVMKRMSDKLVGRDYVVEGVNPPTESDSVQVQVQRLISQAISHENLCQSYIGWCPFW